MVASGLLTPGECGHLHEEVASGELATLRRFQLPSS